MLKKGVMSISTVILVIIAFTLCGVALFGIITLKYDEGILDYGYVNQVYIKEAQLKFLVSQGVDLIDAVKLVDKTKLLEDGRIEISLENEQEQVYYWIKITPPDYKKLLEKFISAEEIKKLESEGKNLKEIYYQYQNWN